MSKKWLSKGKIGYLLVGERLHLILLPIGHRSNHGGHGDLDVGGHRLNGYLRQSGLTGGVRRKGHDKWCESSSYER